MLPQRWRNAVATLPVRWSIAANATLENLIRIGTQFTLQQRYHDVETTFWQRCRYVAAALQMQLWTKLHCLVHRLRSSNVAVTLTQCLGNVVTTLQIHCSSVANATLDKIIRIDTQIAFSNVAAKLTQRSGNVVATVQMKLQTTIIFIRSETYITLQQLCRDVDTVLATLQVRCSSVSNATLGNFEP